MNSQYESRLARLRSAMLARDLDVWIAPTGDDHLSEYCPQHWAFREFLCGFTGSAGTLVVTADAAWLWTDSRYWEQASKQLDASLIGLMREGDSQVASIEDFLHARLPGARVGTDARIVSAQTFSRWKSRLPALIDEETLLDEVFLERESLPNSPIREFVNSQISVAKKLEAVRQCLSKEGSDALLISRLEDIAWLTNLRGQDVDCTPVFYADLVVRTDSATLHVDATRFDDTGVIKRLEKSGITVKAPEDALKTLLCDKPRCLWLDPDATNARVRNALAANEIAVHEGVLPTTLLKSRKTETELAALRETMVEDGIALVRFYAWLENLLRTGGVVTEKALAEKLEEFRSKSPNYLGPSFTTIVAFGCNAALPHYCAPETGGAQIDSKIHSLLLIDSGGQYTGGTTDITRTTLVGIPSEQMRRDFTLVLKGHIRLANAQFPDGVFSSALDTFARYPLWEHGEDFGHGTGHGVGFVLGVHEGPVSISPRAKPVPESRVVRGLVLSNEPGLYRSGQHGVRTENLVTPVPGDAPGFLRFETLTLCPIDTRLVWTGLLNSEDIRWINLYNRHVRDTLLPHLSGAAKRWLEQATEPV